MIAFYAALSQHMEDRDLDERVEWAWIGRVAETRLISAIVDAIAKELLW